MRTADTKVGFREFRDGIPRRGGVRAATIRRIRLRSLDFDEYERRLLLSSATVLAAPPAPWLEPGSDTGVSSSDGITQDDNSAQYPAPWFLVQDPSGGSTVDLYRAPADGVGNPTGPPVLVNTLSNQVAGPVAIADINQGDPMAHGAGPSIPDGTYLYTAQVADAAGDVSPMGSGLLVTIVSTPPAAPATPVLVNGSGAPANPVMTNTNNSAVSPSPANAPEFRIAGVEAGATLVLLRNGREVSQVSGGAGGTLTIDDWNGGSGPGQNPIQDGVDLYTAQQVDAAGNTSTLSGGLLVTITTTPPPPTSAPVLELSSDTSGGRDDTSFNNTPGVDNAPVFDVAGVETGASLVLERARIVSGVVGSFTEVHKLTGTEGGKVPIADLNGGGPIPDGIYVYEALQIDEAGNVGALSAASATITIDTTPPAAPVPPLLEAESDSGVSSSDGITNVDAGGNPIFDVAGVEGGATVLLYRQKGTIGTPVLVATQPAPPGATSATVSLYDPTRPIADGVYTYTARQVDVAGNISPSSAGTAVTYDTATPSAPSTPVLDPADRIGTASPPMTSVRSPTFDVKIALGGLELNSALSLVRDGTVVAQGSYSLTSGLVQISDPGPVTDGAHTYQVFVTDQAGNTSPLTAGVTIMVAPSTPGTPTLGPGSDSGTKGDGITNVTRNLAIVVPGVDPGATLTLYRNGLAVNTIVVASGGTVSIIDPGPIAPGTYVYTVIQTDPSGTSSLPSAGGTIKIVTSGTTPTLRLDPVSDSGTPRDGITAVDGSGGIFPKFDVGNVVAGASLSLLRNGLVVQTLTADASGTAVLIDENGGTSTSPGPLVPDGTYQYSLRQLDPVGNTAVSAAVSVQIVTHATAPAAPLLQISSDTGPLGDGITSDHTPGFGVSGAPAGATLRLLRNGVVIATVPTGPGGSVAIGDPGTLIDALYSYTAQVVDGAGNVSPQSAVTTLSIVSVAGDYNGSGVTSQAVFRRVNPGLSEWFVPGVTPTGGLAFGSGTLDVPLQGDIDGDGKTDYVLYRPSTSQWFIQESSGSVLTDTFGGPGDIPVVGDFDGVGHDEIAVYRPSTGQWFVAGHATAFATLTATGLNGIPEVLHNYDGNGLDIPAVFDPASGHWSIDGTASGVNFGGAGDVPVPLFNYYSNGRDVLAVYRPSTSQWFIAGQAAGISFGGVGDTPIVGDFDGIGRDELGVYRPGTGEFFVAGHGAPIVAFWLSGDVPLTAPYGDRSLSGNAAVSTFDFAASAATLSVGSASGSPSTSVSAPVPASSPSAVVARRRIIATRTPAAHVPVRVHALTLVPIPRGQTLARKRSLFG